MSVATQVRDHISKFQLTTGSKAGLYIPIAYVIRCFQTSMLTSKNAHALACCRSLSLILEAGSLGAEQCLQLFSTKISLTSRTWVQNQESLHDLMGYL